GKCLRRGDDARAASHDARPVGGGIVMELLLLSVGIGLVISLFFVEMFGFTAGGMIVPGYLALSLHKPLDVALTVGAGFITYAIVHTLASFMIVYGRRRTVLMILTGYLV